MSDSVIVRRMKDLLEQPQHLSRQARRELRKSGAKTRKQGVSKSLTRVAKRPG